MQFYKERLYILMEGEPNSPEIPFLKFNIPSNKAKISPKLENPSDDILSDITKIENWFQQPININCTAEKSRENTTILNSRFNAVLAEIDWKNWLNNPKLIDFEQAKIYFRGKEAFSLLFQELSKRLDLIPCIKVNKFIKDILLPELEKNLDCLLIQEIKTMLLPYFQKADNFKIKI